MIISTCNTLYSLYLKNNKTSEIEILSDASYIVEAHLEKDFRVFFSEGEEKV